MGADRKTWVLETIKGQFIIHRKGSSQNITISLSFPKPQFSQGQGMPTYAKCHYRRETSGFENPNIL